MNPSTMIRIMMLQVCQPEAQSSPIAVARAASSSRCIGWIKLGCEYLDLFRGHKQRAVVDNVPTLKSSQ